MKTILVGYTGFVGSNLLESFDFDGLFNSKNVEQAFGIQPDLLIYAGVPAEMFIANKNPQEDMNIIRNAANNIQKIAPKQIVLVSTAAVYENLKESSEHTVMSVENLSAYGLNRYFLECWVQDNFSKHLIIRLPALFGENLKKNFIYDMIHYIPKMLSEELYRNLGGKSSIILDSYELMGNGFYGLKNDCIRLSSDLKTAFRECGFSALNFTDSRSKFQFYNLSHLGDHIKMALDYGISKLNITSEPISASELYHHITGEEFNNILPRVPYNYDLRTEYARAFGGENGYFYSKKVMLEEIKKFVEEQI